MRIDEEEEIYTHDTIQQGKIHYGKCVVTKNFGLATYFKYFIGIFLYLPPFSNGIIGF
jgi:hypothetical protein